MALLARLYLLIPLSMFGPYFKTSAVSNSFAWTFYVLIRVSWDLVGLLCTSSTLRMHNCFVVYTKNCISRFFSIVQNPKTVLKQCLWSYYITILQNDSFSHSKITKKVSVCKWLYFYEQWRVFLFVCLFGQLFCLKYRQKCLIKPFLLRVIHLFTSPKNVKTLSTRKKLHKSIFLKYPSPLYDSSNVSWLFIFNLASSFRDLSSLHTKTYTIFHEGYYPLLLPEIHEWYFEPFPSLRPNNGFYHSIGDSKIRLDPKRSQLNKNRLRQFCLVDDDFWHSRIFKGDNLCFLIGHKLLRLLFCEHCWIELFSNLERS